MLWEAFHWFITLVEVTVVIATILVVGLVSAMVFLRVLGRLAGPPVELDVEPDEMNTGIVGDVNHSPPNDSR